ncbi:unnamed protein product, partial [Hapterophycus canaliculatus]
SHRDSTARAEDESCGYVMSVYVMIRVARKCPSNRDELEGCGNPLPRLVQQHAEEILAINAKNDTDISTGPALVSTPLNPRTPLGAGTRPASAAPPPSGGGGGGGSGSTGRRLGPSSESGFGDAGGAPSSIGRSSATTFNPVSSAEPYFRTFNVTPSSVSQFVLAEASRGSPSPLLTHQSPVLNTEELYRAAGWMTPLPKDRSSSSNRDGGGGDSDDDEVMTDATAGGRSSASGRLAVLSAKNGQHDTSQRMAHSLALGGGSSAGGRGAAAAAAATAAGVAAKEAEAAAAAAAAAAADAGVRTADRIRDEIAREPVLSLANLAGFGGEPGGPKAGGDGFGSDGEGGGSSTSGDGADPGDDDGPEEPGIPKSIAEIYEVRSPGVAALS